jgi:antitoxin VapB
MSESKRAKVFWSGRSQAVRLPKEFRFDADEVRIRREGSAVILEPVEKPGWPEGFWQYLDSFGPVAEDFVRPEPLPESPHRDAVVREWAQPGDEELR